MNLAAQVILKTIDDTIVSDNESWEISDLDTLPTEYHNKPLLKLKVLVRKIHRSSQTIEKLHITCTSNKEPELIPVIDVPTCWNSTFEMIKTAYRMKVSLVDIARMKNWMELVLHDDEWKSLNQLLEVLDLFEQATKKCSGQSYVTLSSATPIYEKLSSVLEQYHLNFKTTNPIISKACKDGKTKLDKYYDLQSPIAIIATILDPRRNFKYFRFIWKKEPSWLDMAKNSIFDAYEFYKQRMEDLSVSEPPARKKIALNPRKETDIFSVIIEDSDSSEDEKSELEKYLDLKADQNCSDVLLWWKTNQNSYPVLALMARDYLGVMASSVPCEQVFSHCGNIVTPERSRISDKMLEQTIFLKYIYRNRKKF